MSQHDLDLVAQLERQLQIIRDRTNSVVYNHATAVYITGRPGTGKTHTVASELDGHRLPWLLHNARLTAMGLFELLREHPEHVAGLNGRRPAHSLRPRAAPVALAVNKNRLREDCPFMAISPMPREK